jgi:prepilin-type N-terminal cleavage/methylation domain-containing protein
MAARFRALLSAEDGMTLPELLTTMAILSVVMTGILIVFVGGVRATTDMNNRFLAQQNARIALASMRSDIGSACSATVGAVPVTPPARPAGSMLTLGCVNANAASTVTWCADSATGSAPFSLYRQSGSTCAYNNGTKRVGLLTTNVVFSCSSGADVRKQVAVTLPVDANLSSTAGTYTLKDTLTLRNGTVGASC